jgi:hypothetical protein
MKKMKVDQFRLSWLCTALTVCCLGCGGDDDDSADQPIGPSGDVELKITGLFNDDGAKFERADADEVQLGCNGAIHVEVGPRDGPAALVNWLLRPPGTCGSFDQCGYVVLRLDPSGNGEAERVVSASSHLTLPTPGAGAHTLQVALYDDDGEPFLQEEAAVEDTLHVTFVAARDCDEAPTSSSGSGGTGGFGGTGAGGAAGAAGQGGSE